MGLRRRVRGRRSCSRGRGCDGGEAALTMRSRSGGRAREVGAGATTERNPWQVRRAPLRRSVAVRSQAGGAAPWPGEANGCREYHECGGEARRAQRMRDGRRSVRRAALGGGVLGGRWAGFGPGELGGLRSALGRSEAGRAED
uniref:Uncharacterized protein n=1 Tax=Arundo donax TaxID=35708 RepID=A0A0A9C6W6_ARUDO